MDGAVPCVERSIRILITGHHRASRGRREEKAGKYDNPTRKPVSVLEPRQKTNPRAPVEVLTATTASVAESQLEEAIRIWFRYGDPAAIHTLAAAANGCYHSVCGGERGT